jgi:hypothetical protein
MLKIVVTALISAGCERLLNGWRLCTVGVLNTASNGALKQVSGGASERLTKAINLPEIKPLYLAFYSSFGRFGPFVLCPVIGPGRDRCPPYARLFAQPVQARLLPGSLALPEECLNL